jgi:hypothetical protein
MKFETDTCRALGGPICRAAPGRPEAWPPTASLLTLIPANCARAIVRRAWKRQSDPRMFRFAPHAGRKTVIVDDSCR